MLKALFLLLLLLGLTLLLFANRTHYHPLMRRSEMKYANGIGKYFQQQQTQNVQEMPYRPATQQKSLYLALSE